MIRPKNGCALALASLLVLLPLRALADVDVAVQDGDKAKGTFDPATEKETYRVTVPGGAKLVAKASGKKGVAAHLELFAEAGNSPLLASGVEAGAKSTLTFTPATTGVYRVVATSRDGATTGAYAIAIAWTTPVKVTARRTLSAAPVTVEFGADAGTVVKFKVKAVAGSGALPRITKVTGPGFSADVNLGGTGPSIKAGPVTLPLTGTYSVELTDPGAGGDADVTVTLTPRNGKPRSIDLTAKALGGGSDDVAVGALVGAEGGTVAVPDLGLGGGLDDISGSAVDIPAGALPSGGVIFIGTAPTLDPKGMDAPVGATVLLGPEGTKFGTKSAPVDVTVTIPIDPSLLGADTTDVKIYTRDASGKVTVVPPPYTFDLVAGTVSFPTPHFSSFVAARHQEQTTGGKTIFTQVSGFTAPTDAAIDVTSSDPNLIYYVSEGETIRSVSISGTSTYATALFAGGGPASTDGTDRLAFDFPGTIQAIESDSNWVYAATATQIFRINAAGQVFRLLGDGVASDSGDMGPAVAARMRNCTDLHARQDGFLWVVDQDAARVRLIDSSDNIDAYAGTGTSNPGADGPDATASALDSPAALVYDFVGQNVFLAERSRVRRINSGGAIATVSGDNMGATGCQGGTGLQARYTRISTITFGYGATAGDEALFIGDTSCDVIYRYTFADGVSEIVAGTPNTPGFSADFSDPVRVNDPRGFFGFSRDFLTFLDAGNGRLRQIVIPQGQ